jgi:hypothetical protein
MGLPPTRSSSSDFWTYVQLSVRVAAMNYDARVLGAMLRLARRREVADEAEIGERVSGSAGDVRRSLRHLAGAGLVERTHHGTARLSMAGLAVAVAMLPAAAPQRRYRRSSSRAA